MSRPPIDPSKTTAGIVVDPHTLERVIPESKRPDGSVRKEIKIRPGFTPQEDVKRFRGTRQAQMDANALPKGHIVGWAPPANNQAENSNKPLSKSQKKNAKRKEKRDEKKTVAIKDSWEDDDDEDDAGAKKGTATTKEAQSASTTTAPVPNPETLASDLEKLKI